MGDDWRIQSAHSHNRTYDIGHDVLHNSAAVVHEVYKILTPKHPSANMQMVLDGVTLLGFCLEGNSVGNMCCSHFVALYSIVHYWCSTSIGLLEFVHK